MNDAPPDSNATLPRELAAVFGFVALNAVSFQIVLNSPMILYARTLGASATVIGILTGLVPLLVILQIPAAHYVARFGFKRFVLFGWSVRLVFVLGMAALPLTGPVLDPGTQLAVFVFLMFGFSFFRGIGSCAWLPWITSLIPETVRGRYLAREGAALNTTSVAIILAAGLVLGPAPTDIRFALLFTVSAVAGLASLAFIARIPEKDSPEQVRTSATPVPWRAIYGYRPFRALVHFGAAWAAVFGGINAFSIAYLEAEAGLSEQNVLFVNAPFFLGSLLSLLMVHAFLDRLGSRPVLLIALGLWGVTLVFWIGQSAHLWPVLPAAFIPVEIAMGLASSLLTIGLTRLAMGVIPTMGRSHFFALYSVVHSLILGVSPIAWGFLIDALRNVDTRLGPFHCNAYSIFFTAVAACSIVVAALAARLEEPRAAGLYEALKEILVRFPRRSWIRLWPWT